MAAARGAGARTHVIFVHGLQGDARKTWTSAQNVLWPAWLAEDCEGVAVWSVGYDAPVTNWNGSAMELSDRGENIFKRLLNEPGLGDGDIYFVGHSLGGLVIKQALRKAAAEAVENGHAHKFVERVRKVGFLATPHVGADLAGLGDRLRIFVRPSSATQALIRNDSHLRDLNVWYRGWSRQRAIDHLILYETKNTSLLGVIVKPDSSDPGLAANPTPIDADHISIAKPASRDSEVYRHVRAFVERKVERPVSIEERKIDEVKGETKKSHKWIFVSAGVVLVVVAAFGMWERQKHEEDYSKLAQIMCASVQGHLPPGCQAAVGGAIAATVSEARAGDKRAANALQLLKAGKVAEAEALFAKEAQEKAAAGTQANHEAAAAYRHLGAIAGLRDPKKAREAYSESVRLDPADADGLFWDGWFQMAVNLDAAEKSFRALLALDQNGADPNLLFWARVGLGDIASARGDLDSAVALYREAETKLAPIAEAKPGDVILQYDLAAAKEKFGDALVTRGDLDGAQKMYLAKNDVVRRLADADPDNAAWKLAVSATGEKLGDVYRARGDRAAALSEYRASLNRMRPVRDADPANLGLQRVVSVLHDKIGGLQLEQGDPLEALKNYKAGQEIAIRLLTLDPESQESRRDLSISYNRVGDALAAKGDLDEALKSYSASLDIVRRLVESDQRNAEWRNDLAASYFNIGDVLEKQGDHAGAIQNFRTGHEIREALAASEPNNAQRRGALLASRVMLGDALYRRHEHAEASKLYRAGLEIAKRLATLDASNASWQRSLSVLEERLGDVLAAQGDKAGALKRYRANLAAKESLAASNPHSVTARKDLAVSYWKLGILLADMRDGRQAREALIQGRAIIAEIALQHPDWAEGKRDLEKFEAQIASLSALDSPPSSGSGGGEKRKVRRR